MYVCIAVDYRAIFRPCTLEKFHVHTSLNRNVGLLRIFPSMTTHLIKAFLQPPIEGVVLQSYGAGNVPMNREDIIKELSAATKRGIIIVNITQCATGCVTNTYAPGKLLDEAGAVYVWNYLKNSRCKIEVFFPNFNSETKTLEKQV